MFQQRWLLHSIFTHIFMVSIETYLIVQLIAHKVHIPLMKWPWGQFRGQNFWIFDGNLQFCLPFFPFTNLKIFFFKNHILWKHTSQVPFHGHPKWKKKKKCINLPLPEINVKDLKKPLDWKVTGDCLSKLLNNLKDKFLTG